MIYAILAALIMPITLGWWYGKDQVDPEKYPNYYK